MLNAFLVRRSSAALPSHRFVHVPVDAYKTIPRAVLAANCRHFVFAACVSCHCVVTVPKPGDAAPRRHLCSHTFHALENVSYYFRHCPPAWKAKKMHPLSLSGCAGFAFSQMEPSAIDILLRFRSAVWGSFHFEQLRLTEDWKPKWLGRPKAFNHDNRRLTDKEWGPVIGIGTRLKVFTQYFKMQDGCFTCESLL